MSEKGKIFVVDDDDSIRDLLSGYLRKNGFEVIGFADGESFLEAFPKQQGYQLVVLDIMMPGIDGYEVVRKLREVSKIPVIMLTAVSDEIDRIIGLEMGADDYLAKPFNPRELLARIKAIMRRVETQEAPASESQSQRYCHFNGYCLDTLTRNLHRPEEQVENLSGADFNLLMLLVGRAGQVVSREDIARLTRSREVQPMDRFIDVQISRLRHQLGDDARHPVVIKTVRGKGYVMATEVDFSNAV
ncbi:DNA-binding response regulator [Endozoicomonas sp. OPT23]|uniref:response regulator n=1 Tax=Endozoicomonas sp. OPT23 TaxID=2072845 RepID=UPI00129AAAE4|nr:response regulator [Endozoicomonas sp. OPT23]MRI35477.1 DNA-binding response regulator [Endozoicomonas sp. OPT23]